MTTNETHDMSDIARDIAAHRIERDAFVAPLRARLDSIRYAQLVHAFVIDSIESLIDVIHSGSDSTLDEHGNAIDDVIDPEQRAVNNSYYDDADPTSVERRNHATYIARCEGILANLTPNEIELLESISDVWPVIDENEETDAPFVRMFNDIMDRIKPA